MPSKTALRLVWTKPKSKLKEDEQAAICLHLILMSHFAGGEECIRNDLIKEFRKHPSHVQDAALELHIEEIRAYCRRKFRIGVAD